MIIDVHQHIGHTSMGSGDNEPEAPDAASSPAEAHRRSLDDLGIDRCVVLPAFSYDTSQGDDSIRAVNDSLAAYVTDNGFVLDAFGLVDPLGMKDPEAEVHRVIEELGMVGLAWHNRFQRLWINADPVKRLIAACPHSTRLIAVHLVAESHMEAVWRLEEVLEENPDKNFLAMSVFTAHSQCGEIIRLAARRHNLYVEIGGMVPLGLWIEQFVGEVGSDRMLFGTDLYTAGALFRHNYARALVEAAHISDHDREQIFSGNIRRLLGGNK